MVTADVEKAVFAVVTEPNLVVREPLDELAVTVPLIAGSEPMVTLFPTVTDDMLMGTVPEMLAVTLPICAVPAEREAVTTPILFVPAGRAFVIPRILFVDIAAAIFSTKFVSLSLPERKLTVLPTVTVPEMGATTSEPDSNKLKRLLWPSPKKPFALSGKDKILAVTVPEMAGREETVTVVLAS